MWIAKDKNGCMNAFIIKPRRFATWKKLNFWSTAPYDKLWANIPYAFINTLSDEIKNLNWEDEPIEVDITVK